MEQTALSFGGSWTEEKLAILRKYLNAYTTALKKQPFELLYVDAFAGTGYCGKPERQELYRPSMFPELQEQDAQAYITGSARIALQVDPPFRRYIYIDLDQANCARLDDLAAEYPHKAKCIEVVNADANVYIKQFAQATNWRSTRAVLFLDPFGMEVEWPTIQAIAATQAIDLWYLFPISAVNRMLTRSGQIPEGWKKRLDLLFGSDDWLPRFYAVTRRPDLFGGESDRITKTVEPWKGIMEYIVERLHGEFAEVANKPYILRNPKTNTPLFLMCFAAAKPGKGGQLAVKIAQEILTGMRK